MQVGSGVAERLAATLVVGVGASGIRVPASAFVLTAFAATAFVPTAHAAEIAAAEVREVSPGHFVHLGRQQDMTLANAGDVANGGFVVGTRSVAIIDPGGSVNVARARLAALRARTTLPIGHVVLTHFHPDHVLGANVFEAAGDILAHVNYARSRAQRGAFYLERFGALVGSDVAGSGAGARRDGRDAARDADGDTAGGAEPLPLPTREVRPGEPYRIELGGRTLIVRAHRTGHTDNDVSVFDPDSKTLWAGDLLFAGRTPALDGSLPGWLAVIDELAALAPRVVVPGHGEPGAFATIAAAERGYLETLLDDTRRAIADGKRLADALAAAERAPADGWLLFTLQHPTNVTRAWTELEWE